MAVSIGAASGQELWELTPYRVKVLVAFDSTPEFTDRLQEDLRAELLGRVDVLLGGVWRTEIGTPAPVLALAMLRDLEAVDPERMLPESAEFDKIFLMTVRRDRDGPELAVREFDVRTRLFSAVVVRREWQIGKLRDLAADALWEAFAPLAQIEHVENKQAVLRAKAAALSPGDQRLALVKPGQVFRPVVRYNDRHGNPRRITPVPWTFCHVEEVGDEGVVTRVISGMRSPLSGRRRGRVEPLALAVVPPRRPSALHLQSRFEPKQPLAGFQVYAHPADSKTTVLVGSTDRSGRIDVAPTDSPLRVLIVQSGSQPLARLPIVPGLEPVLTAEVMDDRQRLEAEGFVRGIQEELLDLVARRHVLLAQIRRATEAGQFDRAGTLIEQLQRLPSSSAFARGMAAQRSSLRSSDPVVQAKIDAMFDQTQAMIVEHLDPETVQDVWRQWRAARNAAGS